MPFMRLCGKMG